MTSNYNQNAGHAHKYYTRARVYDPFVAKGEVIKKALFLPAEKCLDIRMGMDLGVITNETHLVIVEMNPVVMGKIKKTLKSWGFKKVSYFHGKIEEFMDEFQFLDLVLDCDLVYLDFCGEMDWEKHSLIGRMFPYFNEADFKSVLAFTFSLNYRNNSFLRDRKDDVKPFLVNKNANGFLNRENYEASILNARWTVSQTFDALGHDRKGRKAYEYHEYKETGKSIPMVFFMPETPRINKVFVSLTAGQKAAKTREINNLLRDYDKQTSAGRKAAIKRVINKIKAEM